MSDTLGDSPVTTTPGAPMTYQPLPEAAPERDDKKIYENTDDSSIVAAAKELSEAREQGRVPQAEAEDEPLSRQYRHDGGQGDPLEDHLTITPLRAAEDLTRIRNSEVAAANTLDPNRLAQTIDSMRAHFPDRQLPADFVEQLNQAVEQRAAAEAQQQPEPQAVEPQVEQQPQQQPDGVDPEIRAALENPKVRAALEAEVQQVEQARQQYATAAWTAAQVSAAAVLSNWPELNGLTNEQSAASSNHCATAIR